MHGLSRNVNSAGHLLNREKLHASRTHPLLLNVALHGMEQALGIAYTPKGVRGGTYALVRYADGMPVEALDLWGASPLTSIVRSEV